MNALYRLFTDLVSNIDFIRAESVIALAILDFALMKSPPDTLGTEMGRREETTPLYLGYLRTIYERIAHFMDEFYRGNHSI